MQLQVWGTKLMISTTFEEVLQVKIFETQYLLIDLVDRE